jgi:hypothetical protein
LTDLSKPSPLTASDRPQPPLRALLLVAVAIAADLLSFGHWGLGTVLSLLLIVVASVTAARPRPRPMAGALALGVLGLLPMLEAPEEPGSVIVALFGLGMAAVLASGDWSGRVERLAGVAVRFALVAPGRLLADVVRAAIDMRVGGIKARLWKSLLLWGLPVGLGIVFVLLFSAANPLIETALRLLTPDGAKLDQAIAHGLFMAVVAAFAWPFIVPKLLTYRADAQMYGPWQPTLIGQVSGRDVALRALILFNLLFAVQTGLDLVYLWGGVKLPDGMTYADYAHRGAYPLIVTALLAGAFVLVALRPGSPTSADRLVRALVYAFIAQNVLLVISSILRLDLYVDVYGLTRLRLAAGLWMGLVALGLVLILVRIRLGRSNAWLMGSNLLAALMMLFGASVVDLDRVVAGFNLAHAVEPGTGAVPLHVAYLEELGPSIIPDLDRALADDKLAPIAPRLDVPAVRAELMALRTYMASRVQHSTDWRDWNWRAARLRDYLATNPRAPEPTRP